MTFYGRVPLTQEHGYNLTTGLKPVCFRQTPVRKAERLVAQHPTHEKKAYIQ